MPPGDDMKNANPENDMSKSAAPGPSPAQPLPYEPPRDRVMREPPVPVLAMTIAFVVCFGFGAGMGLFSGAFVADAIRFPPGHPSIFIAFVFLAIALWIVWAIVKAFRRPGLATPERWALLGLLFGLGAALLLDGICFGFAS
jgi:hypothetical protein